jgi:hypothetical protein
MALQIAMVLGTPDTAFFEKLSSIFVQIKKSNPIRDLNRP